MRTVYGPPQQRGQVLVRSCVLRSRALTRLARVLLDRHKRGVYAVTRDSIVCRRGNGTVLRYCKPRCLPQEIQPRAGRRLTQLNAATLIEDLRLPPSNRLEALKADRKGQWSIRINDQ